MSPRSDPAGGTPGHLRRARRKWLFRITCLLIAAAALWLASAYAVAYRLTRRLGAPYPEPAPRFSRGIAEEMRLSTRDGEELGAWFIDGGDRAPIVLLLHGNGDDRTSCLRQAEIALSSGCAVLMISLRAHGDSTGEINDFGLSARHDVLAAVEWLETRRPGRRIVAWGMSLGAAAAMFAAEALGERVSGYVLECPYRDLRTAVRRRTATYLPPVLDAIAYIGLVAVSPLVLPDASAIAPIDAAGRMPPAVPVLILAGSADNHAPPDEAEEIRLRMKGPSDLVVIDGGTHGRLIDARPSAYEEAVSRFLERRSGR